MITWAVMVSSLVFLTAAHSSLQSDEYFEYYEDEKHHYMLEDPENSSSTVENTIPPASKVVIPIDTTDEELGLPSIQKEIISNNNVTHVTNDASKSPQLGPVPRNNISNHNSQTLSNKEASHSNSSRQNIKKQFKNKPAHGFPTVPLSRKSGTNKTEETNEKILIKSSLPLKSNHKLLRQENTHDAIPTNRIHNYTFNSINNNNVPISSVVELKNKNESFETGLKSSQSFHGLEKHKIYRRSSYNNKPKVMHPFGETAVVHLADILTKNKILYGKGNPSNKKTFLIKKPLHLHKESKESDNSNSNRKEDSYYVAEEAKLLNSGRSHNEVLIGGNVLQDIVNQDKVTELPAIKYRNKRLGFDIIDYGGDTVLINPKINSKTISSRKLQNYTSPDTDRYAENNGLLALSIPISTIIKDNRINPSLLDSTDEAPLSADISTSSSNYPGQSSSTKSETKSPPEDLLSDTTSLPVYFSSGTTSLPMDVLPDTTSLPVDVLSDTTSLPVDFSLDTTSLPVDILSDTTSLPMDVLSDTRSLPEDVSSDTILLPMDFVSDTTSLPVDFSSDTTSLPVYVLSHTTSLPMDVSLDTASLPVTLVSDESTSAESINITHYLILNNIMPASNGTYHDEDFESGHLLSDKHEAKILDSSKRNNSSTPVLHLNTRDRSPKTVDHATTESIYNLTEDLQTAENVNSSLLPDAIKYGPTPFLQYNETNSNNSLNIGTAQHNSSNLEIHNITYNFKTYTRTPVVLRDTHQPRVKPTTSNYSKNIAETTNASFIYPKTSIYPHNKISLDEMNKTVELTLPSKNKSDTKRRLEIEPMDGEVLHSYEHISYPLNYTVKEKYIPLPRNSSGFEILRKLNVSFPLALYKLPPRVKMITTKIIRKRRVKKPRRKALADHMKPNTSDSSHEEIITLPVLENTTTLDVNEISAETIKNETTFIPTNNNRNDNSTLLTKDQSTVTRETPLNQSTQHIVTLQNYEDSLKELILNSSKESKTDSPVIHTFLTTNTTDHVQDKLVEKRIHIKPEREKTQDYSEGNTNENMDNTDEFKDAYVTTEPNVTDMCELHDYSPFLGLNPNNKIIDTNRRSGALKDNIKYYTTSSADNARKIVTFKKEIKDAKSDPSKMYTKISMSNFVSKPSNDKRDEPQIRVHADSNLVNYLLDKGQSKENSKEWMDYEAITVEPDLSQGLKATENDSSVFETVIETKSITKNTKTVRINRLPKNIINVEIVA
ncbi:uro-adherence factor A-like [Homalodisca vitripennis]|uniref:uro-adherence factor A-like n=1 Tax=Homalodisca vitripennis TaxID=197043 RepID=UPI001EEBE97B|nr:uro-adherence factor A-like [Homalodisca vitripennis]